MQTFAGYSDDGCQFLEADSGIDGIFQRRFTDGLLAVEKGVDCFCKQRSAEPRVPLSARISRLSKTFRQAHCLVRARCLNGNEYVTINAQSFG